MSFRGDDQRRYGHVPPVQYPVGSQQHQQHQQHQQQEQPAYEYEYERSPPPALATLATNGAYADDSHAQPSIAYRSESELFFAGRSEPAASAPAVPARPAAYGGPSSNTAMSGYQHQYQAPAQQLPTTYNPQAFARSQSQSLPYHPHPSAPLGSPTFSTASSFQTPQQSYTPAAYNPAAYANTNPPLPQRMATYAGHTGYQQTYQSLTATSPGFGYSPPAAQQQSPALPSPQTYIQRQQQQYAPATQYAAAVPAGTAAYEPQYSSYFPPTAGYAAAEISAPSATLPLSAAAASTGSATSPAYAIPSTMTTQAPYPTYGHSPSSPPAHSPSSGTLQRHPTNAPLPSRPPMEDVLEDEELPWRLGAVGESDDHVRQDNLFDEIEAGLGVGSTSNGGPLPLQRNGNAAESDLLRHGSQASTQPSTHWSTGASSIDRTPSTMSAASSTYPAAPTNRWEDDSDPEGALGVYEMRQADLDEQRFSISGASMASATSVVSAGGFASGRYGYADLQQQQQQPMPSIQTPQPPPADELSDSDVVGMDLGLFSGGYAGNLTYGSSAPENLPLPPQSTTPRPYDNGDSRYTPFANANMDYGGTGGLQAPVVHRLSFDDGDERVSVHSGRSGSESSPKEDYPDMFYHPGIGNRPLPPPPPANAGGGSSSTNDLLSAQHASTRPAYQQHAPSLSVDSRMSTSSYYGQDAQYQLQQQALQQQQQVERSTSMSSHSTTPTVQVPGRSRTDATDERRKTQRQLATQGSLTPSSSYGGGYDAASSTALTYDVITLPSGRRRKFVPSKLSTADVRRCPEPWALSSIAAWIREMADGEPDLKRKTIEEGLVALFTAKVPTMNVADAETLATQVAGEMAAAGILIREEEWVKFGPGSISGVLWQLTGSGCYAPRVHEHETTGRCYSHYCTRTLRKADLNGVMAEELAQKQDWVSFYKISKETMEGKPRKEVERQNVLHEIVTSEEEFNNQLDVLAVLYKKQLLHWQPPIIPPARLGKFVDTVFGKVESMQRVNKDHLLAPLKYRQNEQGPWIVGFADIFREWIRKAKDEYIAYSTAYPIASFTVRKEAARNMLFRQFLEHVRNHRRSDRLGWDTFLKAPITRLQRYSLLLSTVLKNTLQDSEEKANLVRAIEEIRAVTKECDRLVDEMGKKVSLQELQNQLVFRTGSQTVLNLDHLGRELLMQGDLQRMGSKGVRWVDTHALLFDHYFILTKLLSSKGTDKKYDVSKEPIPMPLLLLESMSDDPIAKQKGLATPLTRTTVASASDTKLNKAGGAGRPELDHATTSTSLNSLGRLGPGTPSEEGKTLYPFRVKHLGHEIYTLYATTPNSRQEWCSKIVEAKTRHARALAEQNAEPFRLRVVSDSGFAYDSITASSRTPAVIIQGTPLDRAIRDMEKVFGKGRAPPPVCRATVNCATGFTAGGKALIAVGTDFGVYITEASNARGWTRTVQISKVTQITILEEFSICIILADKSLISYPLDLVAPVASYPAPMHDSPRHAPQRLAKDVSFFATARMKERTLLFYKRKEGMHNTFKVLEPVFQKASEKKSRFFGGRRGAAAAAGATESFRDFDEFYLPTECFSLNLFQTYVAVSTAKGIEMLTLDRKQPMSVPCDLAMPAIANIAARLRDQRPLGMFRLNDQEFLLAYEDCAVYADKHGEVSRTLIMEYSGKQKKARAATMFGQYLLLFNEDYVEVRNAENGRLRQIIAGVDVRCLDYGFRGPTGGDNASAMAHPLGPTTADQDANGTVKICMAHPEVAGMQIVLELLLNDGHAEQ